jgi:hypothetical protein
MTVPRHTSAETTVTGPFRPAIGVLAAFIPWMLLILAANVLGRALFFLWSTVDLGPELSDSAFYILMREEYTEIATTLTGFGLLVAALAGDASSQSIRVAALAFTFTAPLAILLPAALGARHADPKPLLLAGLLTSVAGSAAYYQWLLMDPSYNGLILPVTFIAAGTLWTLWSAAIRGGIVTAIAASLALGAALFCLLLLKVSSGLVFIILGLPIFAVAMLWQARLPANLTFKGFFLVAACVSIGGLTFALFLSAATLPLPVLWNRFITGFEAAEILASHDVTLGKLLRHLLKTLTQFARHMFGEPLALLLPLLCLGIAQTRLSDQSRHLSIFLALVALLGICVLAVEYIDDFKNMALRVWILALGASLLVWIVPGRDLRLVLFASLFAWAPYGLSLGTNSAIISHASIFAGASVAALFLSTLVLGRGRHIAMAATVLLGVGLTLSALDLAARKPYRMLAPLSEATQDVEAGGENWRVTPPIAKTYLAMSALRNTPEWQQSRQNGRPVLLDLSGRAPALNWMGEFRVPAVAWTLSGYKGSDNFLAWALEQLPDDDLRAMWLAVDMPKPDGTRKGLSTDVLNARLQPLGLHFPTNYQAVGPSVPVAYVKQQVTIYQPNW